MHANASLEHFLVAVARPPTGCTLSVVPLTNSNGGPRAVSNVKGLSIQLGGRD